MTLEEFVKVAAPALQALAILVTAIYASRGLNAWRRQLVGKRRFEIGERTLVAAHKARLSLGHIRNPAGFVGEGASIGQGEGAATLERLQKISADLAELTTTRTFAEIHLGPRAVESVTAILGAFNEVGRAATMLLMVSGRGISEDRGQRESDLDKREAWRLTIYGGSNDDLAKRVDDAITELERVCRPFLE